MKKSLDLSSLDIVYIIKDAVYNEELRYSLRSVAKNFPHNRVWFYGGRPVGLKPDKQVVLEQKGPRKYDRVRYTLDLICKNDEITEDFILFNDDFFVMDKVDELPLYSSGMLVGLTLKIESQNDWRSAPYTAELKHTAHTLMTLNSNDPTNFELHLPMRFNRAKLLEIIERFPDLRGTRSLYGNIFCEKDHKQSVEDVKIWKEDERPIVSPDCPYLSTSDESFTDGLVGQFIRDAFPDKCRFEN